MNDVYIAWLLLLCVFNIVIAQYTSPNWQNVAVNKQCNMSSIYTHVFPNNDCSKAINGNTGTKFEDGNCIHNAIGDHTPSWTVDLGDSYTVRGIRIYAIDVGGFQGFKRMGNVKVTVDSTDVYAFPADTTANTWNTTNIQQNTAGSSLPRKGRYVKLWKNTATAPNVEVYLNICEVEAWVCSPGYYGPNCSPCRSECTGLPCDDISNPNSCTDPCASSPCQNSGTCLRGTVNNAGTYTCQCARTGYQGPTCQQDIDECSPNPCEHGLCTDQVASFSCECDSGYAGVNCSIIEASCSSSTTTVSAGVIAGSVFGGMVLGAAILGIVGFFWLRRRSRGAQDSPTQRHRDGSKVTRDSNSRTSSSAAGGEDTGPRQQEEPAVEYYSSANPDQVHLSPTKGKNRVTDEGATANSPYYNTALDDSDEGVPSQTAATSTSPSATAAAAESNYEELGARGIYDRPEMYENRMEHHVYTGMKKK